MLGGNIHAVVPERVYRSAQLGPAQLRSFIRRHHIRTVVSLRGGDKGDHWFDAESVVCKQEGVELRGIHLRATALPPPKDLVELLSVFDRAPYPLLFHCKAGSDRSGLAAVLYLNLYERVPLRTAEARGLSWRYGHFRLAAGAMDDFFDLYRKDGAGRD